MQKPIRPSVSRLGSLAAVAFLAAPLSGTLVAQQPAAPATAQSVIAAQPLQFDLQASLHAPLDLAAPSDDASSSSSSSLLSPEPAVSGVEAARANLAADPAADGNGQPPPYRRRRYGRPSYNDRWHNADGSNRLAFVAGAGFNVPVGSASSNYLNTNYRFEVGGGINLNKKLGVLLQFDYDHFGIPGAVLANQQALYNNLGFVDQNGNLVDFSGLDGNAHIWSFTLNPTYNFYQGDKLGAYAVVGGGFYHKVTNFTLPQLGEGFDYYYGLYQYTYNQNIDSYTSNAAGVTGGVGVTYKFSRFANQRLFAEARYVHTFNSARAGDPTYSGVGGPGQAYNLYPPNANETSYLPITVGLRF